MPQVERPCISVSGDHLSDHAAQTDAVGEGQTGLAEAEPTRSGARPLLRCLGRPPVPEVTCLPHQQQTFSGSIPASWYLAKVQAQFRKPVLGKADKQRSRTGQPGSRASAKALTWH